MKHKRLNRDGWGFQHYPYYQMWIDEEIFHGLVCLIRLADRIEIEYDENGIAVYIDK